MKKFIYGALLIGCALFSVSCDDDEKGPALPVEVAYQNASGSYLEGTEQMAVRTYEQRTTIRYQVSEISAFYPDCW